MSITVFDISPQGQQRTDDYLAWFKHRVLLSTRTAKADVAATVRDIIERIGGDIGARDDVIIELTERYDGVRLAPDQLTVEQEVINRAGTATDGKLMDVFRRAADNIRAYQESILVQAPEPLKRGGRDLGVRYTPVDRVGVYVPGGRALYPSTVLMTVVPAQVAGVREIAIVSPPTTGGDVNPMVLALAGELGVKDVYRVGGAQAIAALAFGTGTIDHVDKIVGPGNAFVAEAKRQLFGVVGIDSIAGPSEVVVVADDSAIRFAAWIAADMLAQTEHDPGWAILITPSHELAEAVQAKFEAQVRRLTRAQAIRKSLQEYSAILITEDLKQAYLNADGSAPEHLQIIVAPEREEEALSAIRHAGAIFVGANTPVPLGDYYAGPSHVLPTGGTARFFGPLSCNDFLKASSVVRYDAAALAEDAQDVIDFATCEGLTAHAEAVRIRMQGKTAR